MNPSSDLWWLVSRASGIVALTLISLSVILGLAMANRIVGRPGAKRTVARLHEHIALTALLAIAAHGLALLGDRWLRPGVTGIAVPFALGYRPLVTGVGVISGYLALVLGPSFYLRRRIGARRWRRLHTLIAFAWLLAVVHTLGAGSDAQRLWLKAVVLGPAVPVVYLLVLRLSRASARTTRASAHTGLAAAVAIEAASSAPHARARSQRAPSLVRDSARPPPRTMKARVSTAAPGGRTLEALTEEDF